MRENQRLTTNKRSGPVVQAVTSRRAALDAQPVTLILFPGASLMEIRSLAVGVTSVRCPGCGAIMVLTSKRARSPSHLAFIHEDPDCPILARIEATLAGIWAVQAAATN